MTGVYYYYMLLEWWDGRLGKQVVMDLLKMNVSPYYTIIEGVKIIDPVMMEVAGSEEYGEVDMYVIIGVQSYMGREAITNQLWDDVRRNVVRVKEMGEATGFDMDFKAYKEQQWAEMKAEMARWDAEDAATNNEEN